MRESENADRKKKWGRKGKAVKVRAAQNRVRESPPNVVEQAVASQAVLVLSGFLAAAVTAKGDLFPSLSPLSFPSSHHAMCNIITITTSFYLLRP